MEGIADDVEAGHFCIGHPEALFVGARIEDAVDLEAGPGRGCADQLDHRQAAFERSAPPILSDVTE